MNENAKHLKSQEKIIVSSSIKSDANIAHVFISANIYLIFFLFIAKKNAKMKKKALLIEKNPSNKRNKEGLLYC